MKILVNIYIPSVGISYDILVPSFLRIRSISMLVAKMAEDLSNHHYVASGGECLCSVEKNILLRPNGTLEKYGIRNGDHLVMM